VAIPKIASASSALNSLRIPIEIGCNVADYNRSGKQRQLDDGIEDVFSSSCRRGP
jgi:hypothetical protein